LACVPEDRAAVIGDLDDEWRIRRQGGYWRATGWYLSQAARSIPALAVYRLRVRHRRRRIRGTLMRAPTTWLLLPSLLDLRSAGRQLVRHPGFTLAALVTFALGVGANTAVFSVAYNILFKPLPYRSADRLVALWPDHFFSNAELRALEDSAGPFDAVGAAAPGWHMALTGVGDAAQLTIDKTSANLFDVLGVAPTLGRTFVPDEGRPGGDHVIVLSAELWRERFGGDASVVGRVLQLDHEAYRVIGVMPADSAPFGTHPDAWTPFAFDPKAWYHRAGFSQALARLRPGVTLTDANRTFRTMIATVKTTLALPGDYGRLASLTALRDLIIGDYQTKLLLLLAAAGLVVVLAGANVGGLLLTRIVSRQRELAVRLALGAGRRHVTTLLMTESVILAGLGGLLGMLAASSLMRGLIRLLPADTPRLAGVAINLPVLGGAAAVTILAGVIAGLLPFLVARRTDLQAFLRATALAQRSARARNGLVTVQVALAVVLLSGATLMVQTLWHLARVDLGFVPRDVVTFRVQPAGGPYETGAAQNAYYDTLFARLQAIPDVLAVGAIQHLPLSGYYWVTPVRVEGRPVAPNESLPSVQWRFVRGPYFRALGIPLRAGREFTDSDHTSDPVVIVNESFARHFWGELSPVGRRVAIGRSPTAPWLTVVGVVGDVRHDAVSRAAQPEVYQSHRPGPGPDTGPFVSLSLAVRVSPGADHQAEIATVARGVDRNVPVAGIEPLEAAVARSLGTARLMGTLFGAFALIGILLGAVGVYGVVAYNAAQRSHEFGVRLALGATPTSVVRLVVREGFRHTLTGVACGLVAAGALTRTMRGVIYGVTPNNAPMFVTVGAILIAIGLVASAVPARLAGSRSPLDVLREP
jgi:predicted permease